MSSDYLFDIYKLFLMQIEIMTVNFSNVHMQLYELDAIFVVLYGCKNVDKGIHFI